MDEAMRGAQQSALNRAVGKGQTGQLHVLCCVLCDMSPV